MSAARLEQALRERGLDAAVEPEGGVAVMRLRGGSALLTDAAYRQSLVALAAEHGFRNLALEVGD